MRALVIGYGSIGSRHARILRESGFEVAVVSARDVDFAPRYGGVGEAVRDFRPEYTVIANRTGDHLRALDELASAGFSGRVLLEKPVSPAVPGVLPASFSAVYVAYNLRFHPLLLRLRKSLEGQKVLFARIYVGKYLPEWRPGSDYRESYSARLRAGGGVLRDLSHELDYANWLLGPWIRLTAAGGHFSHLDIDSDDVFAVLLETRRCPVVSVAMNYLDRTLRREVLVHTDEHTFRADLARGIFETDGQAETFETDRDLTYREEHRAVAEGRRKDLCGLEEGIGVVRMVEAAERAAREKIWVEA